MAAEIDTKCDIYTDDLTSNLNNSLFVVFMLQQATVQSLTAASNLSQDDSKLTTDITKAGSDWSQDFYKQGSADGLPGTCKEGGTGVAKAPVEKIAQMMGIWSYVNSKGSGWTQSSQAVGSVAQALVSQLNNSQTTNMGSVQAVIGATGQITGLVMGWPA